MSAPKTHDPLVVNTTDGAVWQRRAVTADGHGLYAVTGSCSCPEYLMATLAELAAHGIVGPADALPMPVGSAVADAGRVREELFFEELEMTARLRLALDSAQRGRREARARIAELEAARQADHETWQHDLATARTEREASAARVAELEAKALNPYTPRLCACGHSNIAHSVPAPHSCFAFGQTCPCPAYRQLPHDEAVAQLDRNRRAAAARHESGDR